MVSVPHMVVDANGFDAFLGLLLSSDRILPVVVLTEIPAIHEYAINAFKLAMDIQGLAHVFCMDRKSTFDLTDRVGCLYAPKSEPEPAVSCIDI